LFLLFTITTITTVILLLLLLFHYYHYYKTIATDKPLRARLFLGAAELTTHLLRVTYILWLPLCRINKFGLYFPRRLLRSPILVGHQWLRWRNWWLLLSKICNGINVYVVRWRLVAQLLLCVGCWRFAAGAIAPCLLKKGKTPVLSAIPWITDSTTVQNVVIIAIVSITTTQI
jgi:hypothetical protein